MDKSYTKLYIATLAFLLVAGTIFWPTLYRYDQMVLGGNQIPIRINRLTGFTEFFAINKWIPQKTSSKPAIPTRLELNESELKKLDGKLLFTNHGYLKAEIYNGNEKRVNEIIIEFVLKTESDVEILRRSYSLSSTGGYGLSSSEFIANAGFKIEQSQKWQWSIMSAKFAAY